MAYASFTLRLGASAVPTVAEGTEILEAAAQTTSPDGASVLLRARSGTGVSKSLAEQQAEQLVIAHGELSLDPESGAAVLMIRELCKAYADQYLNNVVLVGRLSGNCKVAQKSVSTSLASDRYVNHEGVTDWFRVRFFGGNADRIQNAAKGSLVTCSGCLESRTNKDGLPYPEIKGRSFRVIQKGGSGSSSSAPNPAAGTTAAGYEQSDFEEVDEGSFPLEWPTSDR